MEWLLLAIAVFAVIGGGYIWTTRGPQRRLRRRLRRLSPRKARRALAHAHEQQEEAERTLASNREVATQFGFRNILPRTGAATALGAGGGAEGGAGGDAGEGGCE